MDFKKQVKKSAFGKRKKKNRTEKAKKQKKRWGDVGPAQQPAWGIVRHLVSADQVGIQHPPLTGEQVAMVWASPTNRPKSATQTARCCSFGLARGPADSDNARSGAIHSVRSWPNHLAFHFSNIAYILADLLEANRT
jgi:hypothetical protein